MVKIVAEIGINHNGSVDLAKRLIDTASFAGCDYVKFQKRTPDLCVPERMKGKPKNTPWGTMSYLEYKRRIEFGKKEYDMIADHCARAGMGMFFSVWDPPSVDFAAQYGDLMKIPSASLTDKETTIRAREKSRTLILSTGMSTEEEIDEAVAHCNPDVLFHTNSSYPSPVGELNLNYMLWLSDKHRKEVGYSGHEFGLATTFAAVALGAKWIERHVTMDRLMWGSDQMSSVEPAGLMKLVRGIRDIEASLGEGGPRSVYPSERTKKETLRT